MARRLQDVKVGDRVWLGRFNCRRKIWNRLNLDEVCAVTAKKFRVKRYPKDLYDKSTGVDYKGAQYVYYAVATPEEITAWEAAQAQKKKDEENAQAESERLYQEKCARVQRLSVLFVDRVDNLEINGDVITIEIDTRRYHVKEIETNGE